MTTLTEFLSPYHPALLALGLQCIIVLLLSLLTAPLAFIKEEQTPGEPIKGSHKDFSFRVLRTHANSVENLPMFIGAVLIAVLVGVNAVWVNWLAGLHVGFRLLFWIVYYSGKGKIAGGPRTLAFLGGLLMTFILLLMAVYKLIGG